ncbi:hypothetical protein B1813_01010 [Saccharomonospora piscinae]|uniref:Serine/threonine protein phosphatase n=1 Tax=Saccharomonospora piscinae TaxID=687388 RepID=A0A1V9ACQ9_SACPI|nr:MerR family transcriptional regulator [Saccharomonospora piscinae]OQO94714.1 hypothetical protein B1813_01010 [Saccharomonospora piscinae]
MRPFGIGDFAAACGLTPKALRLYGELGLLVPVEVDAATGYRRYDGTQLPRARLIAWLRGVGMPLSRIRVLCDLPPVAAAEELGTYWRQVEADVAARRETVAFLVDQLRREDIAMTAAPSPIRLEHACCRDTGMVRTSQQDSVFAGTALFAVADGFETPEPSDSDDSYHDTASAAALRAIRYADATVPAASLTTAVTEAFHAARTDVSHYIRSGHARRAGTTLTMMLWSGGDLALAHVGDSRAYLLRDGELHLLTQDHTYVRSLVDEGRLTPAEAAVHPERFTLLRALHGDAPDVEPDLHLRRARLHDRYALCSDGVHAVLPDLAEPLRSAATPGEAVKSIRKAVFTAGAPDNFACLVVDVCEPGLTGK